MRNSLTAIFSIVVLTLVPKSHLRAQVAPFTYELRGGASIPVGRMTNPQESWAGALGTGPSFGMDFAYAFRWFAAGYGGFSQHRFHCPAAGCGRSTRLVATGFDAGIRWILGSGAVIPVVRTGVVAYRVEGRAPEETGSGTRPVVSHWSLGGEAGLGVMIHVGRSLVLSPGVRYVRMRPRFRRLGTLPVEAVVADVGLVLGF